MLIERNIYKQFTFYLKYLKLHVNIFSFYSVILNVAYGSYIFILFLYAFFSISKPNKIMMI